MIAHRYAVRLLILVFRLYARCWTSRHVMLYVLLLMMMFSLTLMNRNLPTGTHHRVLSDLYRDEDFDYLTSDTKGE